LRADPNCEDCKGEGLILTEGVHVGRLELIEGQLGHRMEGKGDWIKTQCHCVGEFDD
jgi:hypothetical protein